MWQWRIIISFNLSVSLSEDNVELGNEIVIFVWELDGMVPVGVSRWLGCGFVIIYDHVAVILHHGVVVVCVREFGQWLRSWDCVGGRLKHDTGHWQLILGRYWGRGRSSEYFENWFALMRLFDYYLISNTFIRVLKLFLYCESLARIILSLRVLWYLHSFVIISRNSVPLSQLILLVFGSRF